MSKRTIVIALGAIVALVIGWQVAAFASHPEASLPGSNFEIDVDANLKLDDPAPSIDWASVSEIRKADTASGQNDESFGNGTKEDTAVPSVVTGGIPPNKSDLKFFGVYQEGNTSSGFLNLFWSRVQDPTGTTNMDFEFNKNKCEIVNGQPTQGSNCSANNVTPIRSVGDVLIQYDLSNGGVNPTISIRRWQGSAWGPVVPLSQAGNATGSINASAIPAAESDGIGAQDPRTFGEAQIALSALLGSGCSSFGSAYLKSRSSDQFNSALKDFVPPVAVNITNCGSVKIVKKDDAGANLAGAEFTLYKDIAPIGGSRGNEDTITTFKCTTAADGTCTISDVPAGEYWAHETVTPPGHTSAPDQHVTVVAGVTDPVTLNFVDPRQRGAILVTKLRKHASDGPGDHPQSGVDFTVNGVTHTTGADGKACFDNLLFGDYTVHETTPAGYHGEADKTVTVDNAATCDGNPYVGENVTFHNTPLSNITVSFASQVTGGTASKISCTGLTADPADGTPNAFDDTSEQFKDLEPGTYNCTVVIDP